MKNKKPVHFILGGSAIIVGITLLIVIILDQQIIDFPLWVEISLPLSLGLASFGIFYSFFKRYINERLRVIYRTIKTVKGTNHKTPIKFSLNQDVFKDAELATQQWSVERNEEISKLKDQENFRREFLGNLAHELKTPLFSIQGYILTLLDGGLEDQNVNRMFLERASVSVERMAHLLEDLDEITKLEFNALKMDKSNFDIKLLCDEIIQSLELKAAEKEIKLRFSKEYSPTIVFADRAKISQVLTNLINNSINYGNVKGTTTIRFFSLEELVLIEVSDNGPGIEPESLSRLFERFYRVEKSRTRNEGGSGLGLAIAKQIIEAHQKTITVRSTVGIGSTFAFSLDKANTDPEQIRSSRGILIR